MVSVNLFSCSVVRSQLTARATELDLDYLWDTDIFANLTPAFVTTVSESSNHRSNTGGGHGTASFQQTRAETSLELPDNENSLPKFFHSLPCSLTLEDFNYLSSKGALSLPSAMFQSTLLHAYIEFVHPYLPILDLHEFLSIINQPEGSHGQISLLLYQAVMFSATAFVDLRHLRNEGFTSRTLARQAFFVRARVSRLSVEYTPSRDHY